MYPGTHLETQPDKPAVVMAESGWTQTFAELDAAGAVTTQYVYGTGGNVPDSFVRGGVTYRCGR